MNRAHRKSVMSPFCMRCDFHVGDATLIRLMSRKTNYGVCRCRFGIIASARDHGIVAHRSMAFVSMMPYLIICQVKMNVRACAIWN